jgi:uncharacterized protein
VTESQQHNKEPGEQSGEPYGGWSPPPPPAPGQADYRARLRLRPTEPGLARPAQEALMVPDQERTWAGAAHWGAFLAGLVAGLAVLAPLIVLVVKGDESPFVRRHAVESLNFQISALVYGIMSAVLCLVLVGFVMLLALAVLWIVTVISASVAASNGREYRYPLTMRLVS